MREKARLEDSLKDYERFRKEMTEARDLLELARSEKADAIAAEALSDLAALRGRVDRRKWEALFDGEADENSCYLEVHAGAGGTESQDWAAMLLRMYERWAQARGYAIERIAQSEGEEAGVKSATIAITGAHAYGWLKYETGVHRLVRISPFDSGQRRHTSFSKVGVYPEIDESIEIAIDEKDVRIDTYRARGAGGQHVNTTDSAVRMTHTPSGIVVQCQSERSQHKNRKTAWDMLRARLYEAELRRREVEKEARRGEKTEIGWGQQIRSYVLQPYQLVKDLRSGAESRQPRDILDGDLDAFLIAQLSNRAQQPV